jgi:hypothetical protein
MQIPHSEAATVSRGAFRFLVAKSIRRFFSGAPAPLLSRLRNRVLDGIAKAQLHIFGHGDAEYAEYSF